MTAVMMATEKTDKTELLSALKELETQHDLTDDMLLLLMRGGPGPDSNGGCQKRSRPDQSRFTAAEQSLISAADQNRFTAADRNLFDTADRTLFGAADQSLFTAAGQSLFSAADRTLFAAADRVRRRVYGDAVYLRGLIELTNHCRNDCYYCGIRRSNRGLIRYRLDKETILACCAEGWHLGYRTFVLQGGEDPYYTDAILCDLVSSIRDRYPDCAITLSMGERSRDSYRCLYEAGARRYLLRHEAADPGLYRQLHPAEMVAENRIRCLYDLKELGYQVGAGFMVGVPGQTPQHLLEDLRFLQRLQPDMIGIGPFLHHRDTPFRDQPNGDLALTLRLLAILRLLFPTVLLPATTALASLDPRGRTLGLQAGANVVMPNLSPDDVRDRYSLYDNKACRGSEGAEGLRALREEILRAGYCAVVDIGDVKKAGEWTGN